MIASDKQGNMLLLFLFDKVYRAAFERNACTAAAIDQETTRCLTKNTKLGTRPREPAIRTVAGDVAERDLRKSEQNVAPRAVHLDSNLAIIETTIRADTK